MISKSSKYFKIPIDQELGNCDRFLSYAMDSVAKAKGYKNAKRYLKAIIGCSGNSVKKMTQVKTCTCSSDWSLDEYETRDSYCHIRRLDKEKYVKAIHHIISEYFHIASKNENDALLEYLHRLDITPRHYVQALCYKTIDGLEVSKDDPTTANRINSINNADEIAIKLLTDLTTNGVEIKL